MKRLNVPTAIALVMLLAMAPGGAAADEPAFTDFVSDMAVDGSGNVHAAFLRQGEGAGVYYATDASGEWLARPIATTGYEAYPHIAIDNDGVVHVVYSHYTDTDYQGIYYATNRGGTWQVARLLEDSLMHDGSAFALGSDGRVHLAWHGAYTSPRGLFYAAYSEGVVTVERLRSETWASSPVELAVSPTGVPNIVFETVGSSDPLGCGIVRFTKTGALWTSQSLYNSCSAHDPSVGVSSTGSVHIVWHLFNCGGISCTAQFHEWTDATNPPSVRNVYSTMADNPSYAFAEDGSPRAAFLKRSSSINAFTDLYVVDGSQSPAVQHQLTSRQSNYAFWPTLALDGQGGMHVMYTDPSAGSTVVYSTNSGGSWVNEDASWTTEGTAAALTTPLTRPLLGARLGSNGTIPMQTGWAPISDSAATVEVARSVDGGPFASFTSTDAGAVTSSLAHGKLYQHRVRTVLTAATPSPWVVGDAGLLVRLQEKSARLKFTGTWTRKAVSGASGGYVRTSTAANSKVVFNTSARSVALVSTTGKAMGRATVLVNGAHHSTIDLYQNAANRSRTIAWVIEFTDARPRQVSIVVVGAGSRKRVDIDAIIAME